MVDYVDFQVLNQACTSGRNFSCTWYIIMSIHFWIQSVNILLRSFLTKFMRNMGLYFSFLVLFLSSIDSSFIQWVVNVPSSSVAEQDCVELVLLPLQMLRILLWNHLGLRFLWGEILINGFNFFNGLWLFKLSISSWWVLVVCGFEELVQSSKLLKLWT